jgi:NADPH-dependent curcumin reductase CurA
MRGWVSAAANYSEPVALGAVMRSLAVGRVEESRNSEFAPGDYVTGLVGRQDYAIVDAGAIQRRFERSDLPISTSLGVLGLNGLTAQAGHLATRVAATNPGDVPGSSAPPRGRAT